MDKWTKYNKSLAGLIIFILYLYTPFVDSGAEYLSKLIVALDVIFDFGQEYC